ncbi:MAG: hypothetical protein ACI4SB_07885 [Acutalibacteraceae bacterium]
MPIINKFGLLFMAVIMIPNIVFALKHRDGFENLWKNKIVEAFEQIGRFGCFAFMVVNVPKTCFGFWSDEAFAMYLIVNTALVLAYCITWAVLFNKPSVMRAVILSVLPSAVFLISAILSRSVLLLASAVIFAPCHVLLSVKNALAADKPEDRKQI